MFLKILHWMLIISITSLGSWLLISLLVTNPRMKKGTAIMLVMSFINLILAIYILKLISLIYILLGISLFFLASSFEMATYQNNRLKDFFITFFVLMVVIASYQISHKILMIKAKNNPAAITIEQKIERWIEDCNKKINDIRSTPQDRVLEGLIVVIDPGHGTSGDSGAISTKIINGKKVTFYESNATWDTALRLKWHLLHHGAKVYLTVNNSIPERIDYPYIGKPAITNHIRVISPKDIKGTLLRCRTLLANHLCQKYGRKKVIFISIHFDSFDRKKFHGITLYQHRNDRETKIIPYLLTAIRDDHRERRYNGKEYTPVRQDLLFVINPKNNFASNRVLIEFGNIQEESDLWRLRDASVHEEYALTVTEGIIAFWVKNKK